MNEYLRTALWALSANKMRSFLTVLGIVIGIAAMTTVTSALEGFNAKVTSTFEELGTSTVYISTSSGPTRGGGAGREQNTRSGMEISYLEVLLELEGVSAAIPSATSITTAKALDGVEHSVQLQGTASSWPEVSSRDLSTGRFFSEYEVLARRSVCVIGETVNERLFEDSSPLGREIWAGGRKLTVTGVLDESGDIMGQDQDNLILIPWTIFNRWEPLEENLMLMVAVESPGIMNETISRIEGCLRQLRGLTIDKENNFDLMTADSLKEGFSAISVWLFIGLLGLSGISLFVGSVGIANIMLVSVTQRTGEIGLRKALGATKTNILWQVLTESAILSVIGGCLGIVAGAGLAELMAVFTGFSAGLSVVGITAGVLVSSMAGCLAGMYPAIRAAGLQPVEALNHSV